jgi:hypothetical protein
VVLPVLFEGQTRAVIELATLQPFSAVNLAFLDQLTLSLGAVFNTIEATMRTEGLLTQSPFLFLSAVSREHLPPGFSDEVLLPKPTRSAVLIAALQSSIAEASRN